jgi:hypothetical protein
LKSIPQGQNHFDCPSELASYSDVSTLPLLLICVDVESGKAYWKHITRSMPQYQPDQKTFRVRFGEDTDTIDDFGIYISRWVGIARSYQTRLANYDNLQKLVSEQLELSRVSKEDLELFQLFIDAINSFLDGALTGFKSILFPGTWKVGVSIFESTPDRITIQLYSIPKGQPAPLVVGRLAESLARGQADPRVFLESSMARDRLKDPVKTGQKFVLQKAKEVVEQRALPLFSPLLSADILIGFVDHYAPLLGLSPYEESYSTADLEYSLQNHIFDICARIIWDQRGSPSLRIPLDLDQLVLMSGRRSYDDLPRPQQPIIFSITSNRVPLNPAFSALEYLKSEGIEEVHRVFPLPDYDRIQGGAWVWQGYSRDEEIGAITNILENIIEEYQKFIIGNRLDLPSSPYLDLDIAIIFEYLPLDDPSNPMDHCYKRFMSKT